eukprot:g53.t1
MGRIFVEYVEGRPYRCRGCHCHLASTDALLSTQFHSKNGRAYLFNEVVNVCYGSKEERLMTTGVHTVRDAFCVGCMLPVGWKYELAYEEDQKYKEGKVILERVKLETDDSVRQSNMISDEVIDMAFDTICP